MSLISHYASGLYMKVNYGFISSAGCAADETAYCIFLVVFASAVAEAEAVQSMVKFVQKMQRTAMHLA